MHRIQRLLAICLIFLFAVFWFAEELSARDRTRQVQISVSIMEVNRGDLEEIGIRDIASLAPDTSTGPVEPQVAVRGRPAAGRTILSAPQIVTLPGQPAMLQVGGEIPFPTTNSPVQDFVLSSSITPFITEQGMIRIEFDSRIPTIAFDPSPGLGTRTAMTSVLLGDGETAVVGGLLGSDVRQGASRLPVLQDVPQLGDLFRSQAYQSGQSDLVLLVTGVISIEDYTAPVRSGFYGQLAGGAGGLEIGSVGLGTVITGGGEEVFLLDTDRRLVGPSVEAEIGYRFDLATTYAGFGGVDVYGSYEGVYLDGDASGRVDVGAEDVAITYFGDAPSTGIALGNSGLAGQLDAEYDWHRFTIGARGYREIGSLAGRPVEFGLDFGIAVEQAYGNYDGFVQSLSFPGIRSEFDQETDDTYIGPRLGASLNAYPTDRFSVNFGVGFTPYYRWSDVQSRQFTQCDLCPIGEQEVEIETDEDDTGFAYRLSAKIGAEFAVTPGFSLFADGSLSYFDGRSVVRNPANPSEPDTHLHQIDAVDWRAIAGARVKF